MSREMTELNRLPRVLLAGLLGILAGLAFGPVFGGLPGRFTLAIIATATAATLVALTAAAVPRLSPTLVALAGTTIVFAVVATVTGTGIAMRNGSWQLLTAALPVDPSGPPLAATALATGLSTLFSGLLAAYAKSALAPVVPPVACLLAALSLGASGPELPVWYVPTGIAIIVMLLATARRARPSPTAILSVALTGGTAVLAATVVGPAMPGAQANEPADARLLVAAPVLPKSGVSPLQKYLAWRDGSPPLKLTGTTSRPGSPLKLATLTRFDGSYWTVSGDYRRAGTRLPEPPDEGRPAAVTQRIRVEAGDPEWLVAAGRATSLTVAGMGVDEATGDIVVPADKPSPLAYEVSSVMNQITLAETQGIDPAPTRGGLTPPLPARIRAFTEQAVAGKASASDQLLALLQKFTTGRTYHLDQAEDADGGHGYYQIQRLLRTTKRGTSEQYASAYAVMLRHLGMDARVVMGFQPKFHGNTFVVKGGDVDAWVEVRFTGLGWVTIDPSPRHNPIGTRPDAPQTTPPTGQAANPPTNPTAPQPPNQANPAPNGTGPAGAAPTHSRPLMAGLVFAAALLTLILTSPSAKGFRRLRRRRDRSPRRAVLGAWWETLDRLREAGIPVRPALTTGDVVRLVSGLPDIHGLASIVDRAAYAPEGPPPGLPSHAWTLATAIRRGLRAQMSVPRRVGAFLDPRPLFPRQ